MMRAAPTTIGPCRVPRLRLPRHLPRSAASAAAARGICPSVALPRQTATGTGTVTTHVGSPRDPGAWPLLPLAPAVVVLLGVAVAVAIGLFGVSNLATRERRARGRAGRAARVDAGRAHRAAARRASGSRPCSAPRARPGPSSWSSRPRGTSKLDASLGMADQGALRRVVGERAGEAISGPRARALREPAARCDAVEPVSSSPSCASRTPPRGHPALLRALVALTTLLVGVAAGGRVRRLARREQGRRLRGRARARDGARALRADGRGGPGAHDGRGGRASPSPSTRWSIASSPPSRATRATSNACAPPTAIARPSSPP